MRAAAVEALGLLNDPSIFPLVSDALTRSQADPTPDVAIAVIGVCEKLRSDPATRAIVESAYHHEQAARGASRAAVPDPGIPGRPHPRFRRPNTGRAGPRRTTRRCFPRPHRPLQAKIETARGEFVIRLAGREAPLTVGNFVKLARASYFDGVMVHRVVPNFVMQDGDPTGTGNGGPGYEIRDELNPLPYERGTVGMALSGPDTGGSQWFVTHSPQPHLNGLYTVFGQVVAGQDVVERIEQGDRHPEDHDFGGALSRG